MVARGTNVFYVWIACCVLPISKHDERVAITGRALKLLQAYLKGADRQAVSAELVQVCDREHSLAGLRQQAPAHTQACTECT